jgi:hypothetical protein
MTKADKFTSEKALCDHFIKALPKAWVAYPESGGYDILLVHRETGIQVGIEAKLQLNAKVIDQVLVGSLHRDGPDFRAVLVPADTSPALMKLCNHVGVTVIYVTNPKSRYFQRFYEFHPTLPDPKNDYWYGDHYPWFDLAPVTRLTVPEYVPDVSAGCASPRQLTSWKIAAIKIAIIGARRGFLTVRDFEHLRINRRLWVDRAWIVKSEIRGRYIPTDAMPPFEVMHPLNYQQIEEDFAKWAPPES